MNTFFEWFVTIFAYTACSLILTLVSYHHGVRYRQDLFTERRASLDFRVQRGRDLPIRTAEYKKAELWTFLNVLTSTIHCYTLVLNIILPQLNPTDSTCVSTLFLSSSIVLPKLCLYLALTYRLELIYKGSYYGFPPWVLRFVRYLLVLYMLFILLSYDIGGLIIGFGTDPDKKPWIFYFDKTGGVYICDTEGIPAWFVISWAFFDVVVTCGFMILFARPIRAILKRIQQNQKSTEKAKVKLSAKVISYAKQVAILCAVISTSTVIFSFLWAVPNVNLFSVDDLINTVALILMSPYYPEVKFYQRLCKICIFCCDRQGITIRENNLETQLAESGSINKDADDAKEDTVGSTTRSTGSSHKKSIASRSVQRVIAQAKVQTQEYNLLLNPDSGYSHYEVFGTGGSVGAAGTGNDPGDQEQGGNDQPQGVARGKADTSQEKAGGVVDSGVQSDSGLQSGDEVVGGVTHAISNSGSDAEMGKIVFEE